MTISVTNYECKTDIDTYASKKFNLVRYLKLNLSSFVKRVYDPVKHILVCPLKRKNLFLIFTFL